MTLPSTRLLVFLACFFSGAWLLAACGNSCKQACENAAAICAAQFAQQDASFNSSKCTTDCEGNVGGCRNISDQQSCVGNAKTCKDLQLCPACLP